VARLLGGIWKFLNSPLSIWLLTTIVVGLLVSFISEEERCYTATITFLPKLARSLSERDIRTLKVSEALLLSNSTDEAVKAIGLIFSGADYAYGEYKDKSLLDVLFDINVSELALVNVGQKTALSPLDLESQPSVPLYKIFDVQRGFEINPSKVAGLRDDYQKSKTEAPQELEAAQEKFLAAEGINGEYPFVNETTRNAFLEVVNQPFCRPLYLLRQRIELILGRMPW